MIIGITGGTGFIGKAITDYYLEKGDQIVLFTRKTEPARKNNAIIYVTWDPSSHHVPENVPTLDVIINLAGATLNKRWSPEYKEIILKSRLDAVKTVLELILQQQSCPLLINASAVGYYGTSLERVFTEADEMTPSDFLSEVTVKWEAAIEPCKPLCSRVIPIRFGAVLGPKEGAFPKMMLPYKFFAGGTIGSGKQWLSWIHIQDLVRLIDYVVTHSDIKGPVNGTAPEPVQMNEVGRTIGKAMNRPHLFPVPNFILEALLGEMSVLVLEGQKVLPQKLLDHGFTFDFSTIEKAISNLILLTNS
ncbi:TIGR01777 family oxidoreductase [Pullulanibacillus sp. KACC 23026]|uniref:TIGR01777 family oxidoreductase n=1 Tax=Pullulanibacillus sp. KACC 23026 TaxID=3028315 RepID=UPI0023B1D5BB|nr:TIGR01777 family oxidoreductase [Pullulanibacillus sp. KACC 23026]WEG12279.1 TIGR01777 family oxidoreductase [Pullulanibacillus sp. KACC 23026]